MKLICVTIAFIMALMPLCFGQGDFKSLIERIEAVETREMKQSVRIKQLERQVKHSNQKLYHMSVLNQDLQAEHATFKQKLADQDNTIATMKTDLSNQKVLSDKSLHLVAVLESTVTEMVATISMLKRTLPSSKSTKYGKQLKQSNIIETHESIGLSYDNSSNKVLKKQSPDNIKNNSTITQVDKSETNSHQGSLFSVVGKNGGITRQLKKTKVPVPQTGQAMISSKQRATTNFVAFHALVSPHYFDHLGTNDNIRFDTVLLNEGAGYHNQHGLFIAPKRGFYLLSVTLATKYEKKFFADILKNGARLMSLSGNGQTGNYLDQASGTIVTKLDAGDEVWVAHTSPTDGSIWGNRFSSFTGVLLAEF